MGTDEIASYMEGYFGAVASHVSPADVALALVTLGTKAAWLELQQRGMITRCPPAPSPAPYPKLPRPITVQYVAAGSKLKACRYAKPGMHKVRLMSRVGAREIWRAGKAGCLRFD